MSHLLASCAVCGEPCQGAYCDQHRHDRSKHRGTPQQLGYTERWKRLSRRARRLQPWCSICGSTGDLTCDHLHWPAKDLNDVQVLCRSCNAKKGEAPGRREWLAKHFPQGGYPSTSRATARAEVKKTVQKQMIQDKQ